MIMFYCIGTGKKRKKMRLRPLQDATAGKGRAEKAVWNRTEAESFRPSVPGIPDFHSDIQLFP